MELPYSISLPLTTKPPVHSGGFVFYHPGSAFINYQYDNTGQKQRLILNRQHRNLKVILL